MEEEKLPTELIKGSTCGCCGALSTPPPQEMICGECPYWKGPTVGGGPYCWKYKEVLRWEARLQGWRAKYSKERVYSLRTPKCMVDAVGAEIEKLKRGNNEE